MDLRLVIMGVTGCGKSTVGEMLSTRTGVPYVDGDDLHPPENIAKMSSGVPLTDSDRAPWLRSVGAALAAGPGDKMIGCSALKRSYRDLIRETAGAAVAFLHLSGSRKVIAERIKSREGHFMPMALLDSQFAALEDLLPDEIGGIINIDAGRDAVLDRAEALLKGLRR